MNRSFFAAVACVVLSAFAFGAAAQTGQTPKTSPKVEHLIMSLDQVDTWGHPDQFGEYAGMRLFSEGRYQAAMKYFKISSRYADKTSQLAIGLMYANGRGVKKDPVTACAWLALAAERKFPTFVATRNRVCDALTPAQHDQAITVLGKLLPVYGDKVAKRRMAFVLKQSRMEETGSMLGFDNGLRICGYLPPAAGVSPLSGCSNGGGFWSSWRWNPRQYFALRDAQWTGTVTVGAPEGKNAPPSKTRPVATGSGGH